ncbi:L,D-transpeptidase family protein [Aliiroseovarius subalbicans]|uniref:L,D-transpeptidase family protein n=1 Tax=Aliiroseovarius subalbicans TaxID=2925840 RepID=UPI001F5AF95F|nr:L,D-transpeptidase family protein [Aliiroseovarius subalbicans]MCI2400182.1 L,D-transpeptidase family protein [Aliiroseovarius subalbicans]
MIVTRWSARFRGRRFPCSIGRGGMTSDKTEGDWATPVGVWRIVDARYRADRIAEPAGALHFKTIGPQDIWSDDPADPEYNHGLRAAAHPYGHEKLRRSARNYDIVLMSDWNWPDAVPGKGSALFVHLWRRPRYPTAGCLAFCRVDLEWIAARWTPRSRIFVRHSG